MLKLQILPRILHFKQPAGTSRGIYTTRKVWYVVMTDTDSGRSGIGECAPLPDLSCDAVPEYEERLAEACRDYETAGSCNIEWLDNYPSILFGLETAERHLKKGSLQLEDTPFSRGEAGIPINGLVWMGKAEEMLDRIEEKLQAGFRCIKVKIGAIDFRSEIALLEHIRQRFSPETIELRVDANGGFTPKDAPEKLQILSSYSIHSIEQPIKAGQWQEMAALCNTSPLPIALDEELIGINTGKEKMELLDTIKPAYIILKPSLHGGIRGSEEWIGLAEERGIGWWITSALESNVGLNAIAQWCASLGTELPQGLGTGMLFTDNINYPLSITGDCLWYNPEGQEPDFNGIFNLKVK